MASDDQFSFPIISNQISQFTQSSSSLWRISSRVYYHEYIDVGFDIDARSLDESFLGGERLEEEVDSYRREEHLEAKMDMLWEDFNQEEKAEEAEGIKASIAQLPTASRTRGARGKRSKRPSLVVLAAVKLLKKLHLIQKSA
ncbi:hypothetical protein Ancab_024437 [Ancistrocladus abbreviatus]